MARYVNLAKSGYMHTNGNSTTAWVYDDIMVRVIIQDIHQIDLGPHEARQLHSALGFALADIKKGKKNE